MSIDENVGTDTPEESHAAPPLPHIVGNLIEFMKRVQMTGTEALAWAEAYQHLLQQAPPK
jgi:hypothetical protein